MKRYMILGVIVLAAAAVFFVVKNRTAKISYTEMAPLRGEMAVDFRETGTVSPRNRLEIKPPVQGRIEDVLVVEGQRVAKGEIIAWLSSSDRAALLDAALSKSADEVKRWEDIYKPTPITAPLDGFIIVRSKEPGQTVTLADPLLVMADKLIIEADVDETDLRYITLGMKVNAFLDAYPDIPFKGIIEHIAYESQLINNVTVYTVKIRPENPPLNFRAGMTATIEVTSVPKRNILTLPFDAITTAGVKQTVMIKRAGKSPETRTVTTGISNGKRIEIVSGLDGTETILVVAKTGDAVKKKNKMGGLPGMGGGRPH